MAEGVVWKYPFTALYYAIVNKTINRSVTSGTGGYVEIDTTLEGYTPIGVIGFLNSGGAGFTLSDFYTFDNDTKFRVYYRNCTSATKTLYWVRAEILYTKDIHVS